MKPEIYKDEGYRLMGAAFEVYNEQGYGLAEELHQESLEIELAKRGIPFQAKQSLAQPLCCMKEVEIANRNAELLQISSASSQFQNLKRNRAASSEFILVEVPIRKFIVSVSN